MRKNAWVICCCTAVLSAFGIFFRWLQNQACFEAETGLAVRGSIWPYAVALMIVIAAVVLAVVCFRMKNQPHTSFPDFHWLDLTDQLLPVARHWKAQGVRFDALYTGYLASDRQVAVVLELLELLREEGTLLFVDPAMADHGKLYAGFGPEFPALMAQVVSKAQITVSTVP